MFALPDKATVPTMYFIGVTTTKSSIMKVFPLWAKDMGLDAAIVGIDIAIHADAGVYREVVDFIKNDELSLGALVTTHKIDLYNAARDMFEYHDPYAAMFGELSCISKENGRLKGHAKDPISSGLALESFVPPNYWKEHGGEVFIMGAGGSAIAMSAYLINKNKGGNIPSKLIISNRSQPRLENIAGIIKEINPEVPVEYHLTPEPRQNDIILKALKPHSLIVNATGLGKDRPGSPLTDRCDFPADSLVWEINYRGDLKFMDQALGQKDAKGLWVEDGWKYFLYGWTQVIAEVFHLEIDDGTFQRLENIAAEIRK
ncbi:shikimate 5-dehydrogenase I alpha [Desulfocucumis palustris]|uniref:Shikimate 5-dehydrogenase I alpha n=1 Tax=Desulfocucumis palustris TaxID=1898651 RepID=A0A2L2XK42_9FIRM|nr:shikimate dehydrogenase [Desulfocucumis palustris]GBF34281.1 shikimate 5-dehydrogenase I alpha [Desulfocucumis palustris]